MAAENVRLASRANQVSRSARARQRIGFHGILFVSVIFRWFILLIYREIYFYGYTRPAPQVQACFAVIRNNKNIGLILFRIGV